MALSDMAIRKAKPRDRQYKLADGGGLYLLVTPAGGRLWRLKYRMHGIERKLSIGCYPDLSLAEARERRDAARKAVALAKEGGENAPLEPVAAKRRVKAEARVALGHTFDAVAGECIDKARREGRAKETIRKLEWARELLRPALGRRPVSHIEPRDLLAVLKTLEAEDKLETAAHVRAFAGRVFKYAIATDRMKDNPAAHLAGATAAPVRRHMAAILDPARVGALLRASDAYSGTPLVRAALLLSPHVMLRPGELRQAEWSEIDFDQAIWRVPAARAKMRREHVFPLSRQVLAILRDAKALSRAGSFVFPAMGKSGQRPMSENTVNQALRRMGFAKEEMSAHGWRAVASTFLNESGKWSPDAIERALAHKDGDSVRGAYHRGTHWAERVEMAQWWSDYLDRLRAGDVVVPFAMATAAAT